jgi:hypothetical protein
LGVRHLTADLMPLDRRLAPCHSPKRSPRPANLEPDPLMGRHGVQLGQAPKAAGGKLGLLHSAASAASDSSALVTAQTPQMAQIETDGVDEFVGIMVHQGRAHPWARSMGVWVWQRPQHVDLVAGRQFGQRFSSSVAHGPTGWLASSA